MNSAVIELYSRLLKNENDKKTALLIERTLERAIKRRESILRSQSGLEAMLLESWLQFLPEKQAQMEGSSLELSDTRTRACWFIDLALGIDDMFANYYSGIAEIGATGKVCEFFESLSKQIQEEKKWFASLYRDEFFLRG